MTLLDYIRGQWGFGPEILEEGDRRFGYFLDRYISDSVQKIRDITTLDERRARTGVLLRYLLRLKSFTEDQIKDIEARIEKMLSGGIGNLAAWSSELVAKYFAEYTEPLTMDRKEIEKEIDGILGLQEKMRQFAGDTAQKIVFWKHMTEVSRINRSVMAGRKDPDRGLSEGKVVFGSWLRRLAKEGADISEVVKFVDAVNEYGEKVKSGVFPLFAGTCLQALFTILASGNPNTPDGLQRVRAMNEFFRKHLIELAEQLTATAKNVRVVSPYE